VGWPDLPYAAWRDTRDTLHMYLQIVGKVQHTLSPKEADWGHAPLRLTARGLATRPIPHANGVFDIDVDLVGHTVSVRTTDGRVETIALEPRSVAAYYGLLLGVLDRLGRPVEISVEPSDVPGGIPFPEDTVHASYDPEWANRFWRVLVAVETVLQEHRARFRGARSPVWLWWGSLDLSYSRSVGEAHAAAGFWPGDERFREAAFYAYTSPRPDGIEDAAHEPEAAFWSTELGEFLLPYDAVRAAADPREALLAFLETTYRAGAERSGWDPALTTG
jgi:hypothetical protein